jgi:hypothetical protein
LSNNVSLTLRSLAASACGPRVRFAAIPSSSLDHHTHYQSGPCSVGHSANQQNSFTLRSTAAQDVEVNQKKGDPLPGRLVAILQPISSAALSEAAAKYLAPTGKSLRYPAFR